VVPLQHPDGHVEALQPPPEHTPFTQVPAPQSAQTPPLRPQARFEFPT
jgi:hypothetical protein